MSNKLTVLLSPLDFVGVVNSFIGIGEALRDRGHEVVFMVSDKWRNKLNIYGFVEEIIVNEENVVIEDPAKYAFMFEKSGLFGPRKPIDKLLEVSPLIREIIDDIKKSEQNMTEIVNRVKPDVIVIGNAFKFPHLMDIGIPWVLSVSCNPLAIDCCVDDNKIPPSDLGLPTNGDPEEWKLIRESIRQSRRDIWSDFNDWIVSKGFDSLPKDMFLKPSPYLNIYMFPKELDYEGIFPTDWHQFDCFTRSGDLDVLELPEKLKNRTGKLIYFSLGTMGSADIKLMKKLVSILSKSEHKFIVSKGPLSDQYELPDNMWGEGSVPQIKVLPIVDLVITHGGNNTLTESFYFGKPVIVLPLFFDQYDNGQRIKETGLGITLDPYECSETELLESIDSILNNEKLLLKMKQISERIQKSKNTERAAKAIENIIN